MHAADAIGAATALRMDNIAVEGDRPVPRFRMAQERNAIQVFNQISRIDIELDGPAPNRLISLEPRRPAVGRKGERRWTSRSALRWTRTSFIARR